MPTKKTKQTKQKKKINKPKISKNVKAKQKKLKPKKVVKKIKPKKAVKKPVKKIKAIKPKKKIINKKKVIMKKTKKMEGDFFENIEPYELKKNEKYMSKPMKEHFKKILMTWKRQLMEGVDKTVHHMQDESANFPDPSDRATQEEGFSLELRARDRERKLIRKIDEALNMIEEGEYGYCEVCGEMIGIRRLEARPTATLCIDCKTLDEIREKQHGV